MKHLQAVSKNRIPGRASYEIGEISEIDAIMWLFEYIAGFVMTITELIAGASARKGA